MEETTGNNMKFLVTGSAGLVGSQVVKDLAENNAVYSCYHETKPNHGEAIKLDLSNSDDVSKTIQEYKPDSIIHLAAMTNVDECEKNPDKAYQINSKAAEHLAKQAARTGAFFLHVSTDYVFDGTKQYNKETDTPDPLGVYGKSKLDGEKRIQNLASSWCIARTSTPFGMHPKKKAFPLWVLENLQQKKEVNVVVDQFTSPTYVPNLSQMLIELATRQINGLFHVAGATRISRYELAELVAQKTNLDKKLLRPASISEMTLWVAKRPVDSSLDISRIFETIDTKPMVIDQALDYFLHELS